MDRFPNFFAQARCKEDFFHVLRKCALATDARVDDQRNTLEAHMVQYVDFFERKWRDEKSKADPEFERNLRHLATGREIESWKELSLEDMHERMFGDARDFSVFWAPTTHEFVAVVRHILRQFKDRAAEKNLQLMLLMRRTGSMVVQTARKHFPQSEANFTIDTDAGSMGISLSAMDPFPALKVDMHAWDGNRVVLVVCNNAPVTWGTAGSINRDLHGQMNFFVRPNFPSPEMMLVLKEWGLKLSMRVKEPGFLLPEQVAVVTCSLLQLMYRHPLKYREAHAALPAPAPAPAGPLFCHVCNQVSSSGTEVARLLGAERWTYTPALQEALMVFSRGARLRIIMGEVPLQMTFQLSSFSQPLNRLDVKDMCEDYLQKTCPGVPLPRMVAETYGVGGNISIQCTWSEPDENTLKTMHSLITAAPRILLGVPLDSGSSCGAEEAASGGGW